MGLLFKGKGKNKEIEGLAVPRNTPGKKPRKARMSKNGRITTISGEVGNTSNMHFYKKGTPGWQRFWKELFVILLLICAGAYAFAQKGQVHEKVLKEWVEQEVRPGYYDDNGTYVYQDTVVEQSFQHIEKSWKEPGSFYFTAGFLVENPGEVTSGSWEDYEAMDFIYRIAIGTNQNIDKIGMVPFNTDIELFVDAIPSYSAVHYFSGVNSGNWNWRTGWRINPHLLFMENNTVSLKVGGQMLFDYRTIDNSMFMVLGPTMEFGLSLDGFSSFFVRTAVNHAVLRPNSGRPVKNEEGVVETKYNYILDNDKNVNLNFQIGVSVFFGEKKTEEYTKKVQ